MNQPSVLFTPETGDRILDLYVNGESLLAISKHDGMPGYTSILKWVRDSEKFRDAFEAARKARAIHLEEKALEIAEGHIDKDTAGAERLRFDIYKWGAEVSDAGRYGKKVTVGGDAGRPIVIRVTTGVPDPESHQAGVKLGADGMVIPVEAIPVPVPLAIDPPEDAPLGSPGDEVRQQSLFDRLTSQPLAEGTPLASPMPPLSVSAEELETEYIPEGEEHA